MSQKYLIVGLGNPGKQYAKTRHNVGFMVVDRLAEIYHTSLRAGKGDYLISDTLRLESTEVELILSKPLTYMNNSGLAVRHALDYYKFELERLLVISDDFQLPFGKLRLRASGSEGGHNGLRSIIDHLGTMDFPRLRLGIGEAAAPDKADYVLAPFSKAEHDLLVEMVQKACDAACDFARHGLLYVMNKYN